MAVAKLKLLSEQDVKSIAEPILRQRFAVFGYSDSRVEEVEDFDGELIFRLTATVSEVVPAKELVDANEAIHSALRRQGEGRFVILATERSNADGELPDEDVN